ncbi:MAG: class I SAM-dependent DNA methyltransferase, partial [Synechococcaceae cyanobacterium SM2_3_60]|nr:class I SAM-dependent DNA methyltransferase [Synechococcaceae cyanobacterium SM2_3_60]
MRSGVDLTSATKLKSNSLLVGAGVKLHGSGFLVDENTMQAWGTKYLGDIVKHYRNGKDLFGKPRNLCVIDFYGLSETQIQEFPEPFQKVLEEVKPERDVNKRKVRRENWWLFGENMPKTRESVSGLARYLATPETAKHRVFVFLEKSILPDNK